MDNNTENRTPILNIAWSRFAQLDAAAEKLENPHYGIRRWIFILGVFASLFAVLTETYPDNFPAVGKVVIKVLLILSPITASVLAAFFNKFYGGGGWLTLRAGAEEIKKEIFMYRTVLKDDPRRRVWLEKRLAEIHRQVFRGLGGEMAIDNYTGAIPPYHDPNNPDSDPGFHDLGGDDYFTFRLSDQLAWHIRKVNKIQAERTRLQWFILIAGALGSVFAALGGAFSLWVAVAASVAAAFIGWTELKNLDDTLKNYSKVVIELMIIYDHWMNLEVEERTQAETFKMVKGTEKILWNQNMEYIRSMQEALADADLDEADLVDEVLQNAVKADARFKKRLRDSIVSHTDETLRDAEDTLVETFDEALGTIVEEASSELVQEELAAMAAAASQAVENIVSRASKLRSTMEAIAEDYAGVEFNAETPASELHGLLQRLPKTGEVKG
ncbi:MAG: SLATT domain-containing protein [Anaerolineae bacterium]|jgi:hypothetical protein|nr:SLATT domain-containing protein [Anaerolineae bacterium]MBT7190307.1 SLATT domain-containing protein [Anaerolineae bacterium]MBT7990270.1 SLATT domain-containing protein [Anaerolineae bacterium]